VNIGACHDRGPFVAARGGGGLFCRVELRDVAGGGLQAGEGGVAVEKLAVREDAIAGLAGVRGANPECETRGHGPGPFVAVRDRWAMGYIGVGWGKVKWYYWVDGFIFTSRSLTCIRSGAQAW